MSATMGRNEYARHRGCSSNAVKKADRDGRIRAAIVERGPGGSIKRIDWRLADELWQNNTDPAAALKSGKLTIAPGAGETEAGYLQLKRRRELAEAQLAELKLKRESGGLVDAAEVGRAIREGARSLRNAMLSIPDKI